jgi:putative PIN family toxin of toxin-antitoxin system
VDRPARSDPRCRHGGQRDPCQQPALLAEVARVLAYPKLAAVFAEPEHLADLVADMCVIVQPGRTIEVIADDDSDNRVLEAAVAGAADYIVSGDPHLLAVGRFEGIPILTPAAFFAVMPTT